MNAFSEERYNGNGLNLVLQRAIEVLAASKTSWNFVRKATVSGDLRDLGFCVDPPKISFRSSRPFRRGCRLGMRGPVIGKERINRQTTSNGLQVSNFPSLNDEIALDKLKMFKSLLLSKSLVEVNL